MCFAAILMLRWERSNNSRAVFRLMCEQTCSEWGESPESSALKDVPWMSRAKCSREVDSRGHGGYGGTRGRKKEGQDASMRQ